MKCFYHNADLDGKCSGAIVKMFVPEMELIGINYGQPFPWETICTGETVWMVDFSLQPFEDMERLNELCNLVWIDHHKSAIEEAHMRGFLAGGAQFLQDGTAACELTWKACGCGAVPQAVYLLGRYDVWAWRDVPLALEFQYGMRQYEADPADMEFWERLFRGDAVGNIIAQGRNLLAFEQRQNEMYAKSCAFETTLDGLRCIAVNKGLTNSLLFKAVYDPAKHDAMISFVWRKGQWKVSIYADKPDVDASAIARRYGGGGHKGAAGFQCDLLFLPFEVC